jgi:hypothetical protein
VLTHERAAPLRLVDPTAEAETDAARPEAPAASGDDAHSRRLFLWAAPIVIFACFVVDQLHALLGYGRLATDEDQTLLWFAGRELLHLHVREPNFYGQNYNTVFEALPGEVLHLLGLSLALASPLGTMLMASACWLVLAWAARRRGHGLAAAAALALPVCLCVPYLLLFDAPRGVLSGDLAGAVAVAAAVAIRRPRLRLAVVIAVGGLGIVWDNAVAVAVAPALAASTVTGMRTLLDRPWRTLLIAGGSGLAPAAWLLMDHLWYRSHLVDLTATNVNTQLRLSVLGTNLSHPGRLFGFYEPQLWQQPAVPIVTIASLLILAVVVSIVFRRPEPAAAALTFLAVLLVTLSVRDTLDVHPDLYLSGSRFLLPMPIGLWVVLYFSVSAARHRRGGRAVSRRLDPRVPMAAILVVAATSMIVAQVRYRSAIQAVSAVDAGSHPVIEVFNPDAILAECAVVAGIYRHTRAQLLVTNQRNVAYGCAAESGVSTLDEDYDRRGWLLEAAAIRPVGRILMQGWTCRSMPRRSGTCRPEGHGILLLLTPRRPPSVSLGLAGAPLRGAPLSP